MKQGATIEQLQEDLNKEKRAGEVAAESNAKRLADAQAGFEEQFRLVEVGRSLLAKKLQEAQVQAEADRAEADRQMQSLAALYEQAHKKSAETQAQLSKLQEMYENALEAAKQKQTEAETQRDEIARKASQEIKALAASIKELQEQADQDSELLAALTAKLQEARDTISRHEEHILKLDSDLSKAHADLKSQQTVHVEAMKLAHAENAVLRAEITKTKSTAKKAMEDIAAAAAIKEQNKSLEQRVSSLQQEITSAKVASAEATFKLERAKENNETLRKAQTEELAKRDKAITEARLELQAAYNNMKALDSSRAPAKKA